MLFDFSSDEIVIRDKEKDFKIPVKIEKINSLNIFDFFPIKVKLGRKIRLDPNSERLLKIKIPEYINKD